MAGSGAATREPGVRSNGAAGRAARRVPRIAVVAPHLGPGGAQQVVSRMTAYWAARGHDVTVITLLDEPPDFFRLHPGVTRTRLPEADWPLVRVRRFLVRLFEGRELVTDRMRKAGGREPAHAPVPAARGAARRGARRRLDGLRDAYIFLLGVRDAMIAFVARHRLLGRSGAPYARLLRASEWKIAALRGLLRRCEPDAVLSVLGATNIISVAASAGLAHRTVVSERNDPSKQRLAPPWDDLRPLVYPEADAVSANSRGALDAMRAYCPAAKLCLAPNPVAPPAAAGAARSDAVLFLARLVPQKAPDVLIEAFARFRRRLPGWTLHLAGDGPLADPLQARACALGLAGAVTFHGIVAEPAPLLAGCRIFALPSRFEGTPNALLEAMANRMACIVSDASPGPLRLIEHGVSGLVVETGSVSALAAALERLARDAPLRRRLGDAAGGRAREFGLDRVGPIWDRILFPVS